MIDREVVSLGADGRPPFRRLLHRREWPYFLAFDLLWIDGEDLRGWPLIERKKRLRSIIPRVESRVRYVDHIVGDGVRLFDLACQHDLEGIVAKWQLDLTATAPDLGVVMSFNQKRDSPTGALSS